MEPNKFERQVQQKLEEFKIPPAEEVWTKVEKGINRKRKDTRLLFLVAFLFVLLSAGFWYFNAQKNTSIPVNKQIVHNFNPAKNEAAKIKKQDVSSETTNEEKKNTNAFSREEIGTNKSSSKSYSSKKVFQNTGNSKINSPQKNPYLNAENISELPDDDNVFVSPKKLTFAWLPDHQNIDLQNPDTLNSRSSLFFSGKKKTIRFHHSWKFGISASAGESWIKNSPSPHYYAPALYSPSANFAQPLFYNRFYNSSPPPFKNSFSFSAGVYAERDISKRFDLNLGLSYHHFSLQNNVRNNFDFVEVPIQLSFELIRNPLLPLTIDGGITPAYLAASNALQYNYTGNSWYHQNALFNKFQANLQAGFSVSVFNRTMHPVKIGPQFSYGLLKLADKGLYSEKHLSVMGIHAQMLLKKK
ncbi:MAG TPA: hypothetical protein VFT78_14440 [Hanamia sp.]|nr:hypothetical protein [Hanamia sp.]